MMPNVSDNQISSYLGSFSPDEFESADEIREFFEMTNLVNSIGSGDYSDRVEVMEEVIEQYQASRMCKIKSIVKEKHTGESGNVTLIGDAYNACNPSRPNGWDCSAVQLDGNTIRFGAVQWDFEDDKEDASDYDWSFDESNFVTIESLDLTDTDEFEEALEELDKY
jgi:hypothetical protein